MRREDGSERAAVSSAFIAVRSVRAEVGSVRQEDRWEVRDDLSAIAEVISEHGDDHSEATEDISAIEDDLSERGRVMPALRQDMPARRVVRSLCPQDIVTLRDDIEECRDDISARGGGPLGGARGPLRMGGRPHGAWRGPVGGGRVGLRRRTGPIDAPTGSLGRPSRHPPVPSGHPALPGRPLGSRRGHVVVRARGAVPGGPTGANKRSPARLGVPSANARRHEPR